MRRHGNTCAPVRAALVQLRVANGVKWGRGREEVEAPERRKRCLSVPSSLETVGGGGAGRDSPANFQVSPALLEVGSAETPEGGYPAVPSVRETPSTPRAAWRARSAQRRREPRRNPDGPRGWLAGVQRLRGPGAPFVLRSLTSGKGQGTVNQRGRERTGAG